MKVTKDFKMIKRYDKVLEELKGKILNIGCHICLFDIKAMLHGHTDITSLDISPIFLKTAKDNAKESGVKLNLVFGSIEALPNEKYDTVILSEIIEHLENPMKGVLNALEVLNDDGKLIITIPAGFAHYSPDHKNFFFTTTSIGLIDKHWIFHMIPSVMQHTCSFINIDLFLEGLGYEYRYELLEYKESKQPSYDFFIVITKRKKQ